MIDFSAQGGLYLLPKFRSDHFIVLKRGMLTGVHTRMSEADSPLVFQFDHNQVMMNQNPRVSKLPYFCIKVS